MKTALLLNNPIKNIVIPSGLVPKGAYNPATDYAVGDSVDSNGSSYIMFNDAPASTVTTDTTYWQVLANKGNTGATGSTGATGAKGDAATLDVGTTTTGNAGTSASVVNSGSVNDAIFDFTIPKGDKGDKGDTGGTGTLVDLGGVAKSLYDANSILYATVDDTPVALTIGASTIVGRKSTGDIVALTASEVRTIINVSDGAIAGATKSLDNLASVAINTSLISDTDSTDDLGSSAKYWANAYVDTIHSSVGRGAMLVVAANDASALEKAQADYVCDGTADNVEIQAAITALPAGGGKIILTDGTFNIVVPVVIKSGTLLQGSGWGSILKLGAAINSQVIQVNPDSDAITGNIIIRDLQIDGNRTNNTDSTNTTEGYARALVKIFGDTAHYIHNITIENCYIHSSVGVVVMFDDTASYCKVVNNRIDSCPGVVDGILFMWSDNHDNLISGNIVTNVGFGIAISDSYNNIITNNQVGGCSFLSLICDGNCYNNTFSNNVINTGASSCVGLLLDLGAHDNIISNNQFLNARGEAIQITKSYNNLISNNIIINAGASWPEHIDAIVISDDGATLSRYNRIIGNIITGTNTRYAISIASATSTPNYIRNNTLSGTFTGDILDVSVGNTTMSNEEVSILKEVNYMKMKNTSGGDLAAGDVVVLKAVAAGDEVTTTTTAGDDKVFGIATGAIVSNTYGNIQILGKTTLLKVDGTTDIAIGDFLSTFTTVKVAKKGVIGDMVFAIALEAYTTDNSSGVIDALLITPRKLASVGASKALDNIASTAVNASIIPATDSAIDLGSSAPKYFANGYFDKIYLNSTSFLSGASAGKVGINTASPTETLDVLGNFTVKDADSATKSYRFRTSGGALDLDGAGKYLYISTYANADFTGTQRTFLIFKNDADYASAYKNWEFKNGSDSGVFTIRPSDSTTGNILFGEGFNMVFGGTTGTKIGMGTDQKLAFHNSTPVVQRVGAAQVAVATTGSTTTLPYGYTTSAQADAIVTLVNEIRATLVEKGLMKGAA
jgi:parallel beta-helix repeat protein